MTPITKTTETTTFTGLRRVNNKQAPLNYRGSNNETSFGRNDYNDDNDDGGNDQRLILRLKNNNRVSLKSQRLTATFQNDHEPVVMKILTLKTSKTTR